MKRIFLICFSIAFFCRCSSQPEPSQFHELKSKAREALAFCKANKLDTSICFFVDMKVHSGKCRMFTWDFKKDTIADKGLCTHGICDGENASSNKEGAVMFSNKINSHCSSLGKYRIGKRGYSNWGINVNYKLHGLEKTNSNALGRIVVLHSWSIVNEEEIYPFEAPLSWGCPAVSDAYMKRIDEKLQKLNTSTLLWIFYL